ncbi:hypothetical protein Ddc_09035 [Ditylenchus destructor]|nr:hypothetical protein Ddc_09035 [Ditylenchus destructor]
MDRIFDNLRKKLEETVDGSDFLKNPFKMFTPNAPEEEQQSQHQSSSGSNYGGSRLSQQTQQSTSDIMEINNADLSSDTNGQLDPDNDGPYQITSDTHSTQSSDTSSIGNTSYGVSSLHTLNGSENSEPIRQTQKDVEWLAACKIFHEEELAQEIDRKNARKSSTSSCSI